VSLDSDWPQQGGWLVLATWERCEKEGNEIHGGRLRQVCRGGGTITTRWSGAAEGRGVGVWGGPWRRGRDLDSD
jgi:hypothetical protein